MMFITLNQWRWHYHLKSESYCANTNALLINTDEISSVETLDSQCHIDGSKIIMKNGTDFSVREDVGTISKIVQAAVESEGEGC